MDSSVFEYLMPTDKQKADMDVARKAFRDLDGILESLIPEGPDKTFVIRSLRTVAMWANVAITRLPDGTPRK